MKAIRSEMVHITKINSGDVIEHNGLYRTVCNNNISHSTFMGTSIFGDNYRSGTKKVKRVFFR